MPAKWQQATMLLGRTVSFFSNHLRRDQKKIESASAQMLGLPHWYADHSRAIKAYDRLCEPQMSLLQANEHIQMQNIAQDSSRDLRALQVLSLQLLGR